MRKFPQASTDAPPPRRGSRWHAVLTIALGLLLAPLVHEATALGVAPWKAMLGAVPSVETPVLDAIGSGMRSAARELRAWTAPVVHSAPWNPSLVFPLAVAWTALAILMLRRG